MKLIIVITLLLSLTSCANSSQYSEEVMFDMASILKDVAQAVDGELKFGDTAGQTEKEIFENAISANPAQITKLSQLAIDGNISNYRILSEFQGNNAVMLICDGDIALMEDAGCNSEFDKIYWDSPKPYSCQIKLDAAALCTD